MFTPGDGAPKLVGGGRAQWRWGCLLVLKVKIRVEARVRVMISVTRGKRSSR